ncbi:MAG: 4-hydroxy-tetrahydrodipicolinate synthase [Rhodospirillales bacterium]|nr:4-hydroxy-tetrahydrodipicolinate synthase [Rhodospirillales bacterium]
MNKEANGITGLAGFATALPTPFSDGAVDEASFAALCDWQISQGIAALVVNGTTGEAPTLSLTEQRRQIRRAVAVAAGRVPVIAGAGSNATGHAIELARQAESAGADALLVVTPYYNRPSQQGLFRHYEAIHDQTGLPILLYDVPARTGCTIAIDTLCRLNELPRIAGLKDATGEFDRPRRLRHALGDEFRLFTGDDATALDYLVRGGDGCVSVVANVAPRTCVQLHRAWRDGEPAEARLLARTLAPLTSALFSESNPVPVKFALSLMGRIGDEVRLPLCPASSLTRDAVTRAIDRFGLLPTEPARIGAGRRAAEALRIA